MDILKEDIKRQKELMNLQEEKTNTTKSGIVEQISGGSGFEQNQGGSDTLTKFKKRQEFGEEEECGAGMYWCPKSEKCMKKDAEDMTEGGEDDKPYNWMELPGYNPEAFYGDGSLDKLRNQRGQDSMEMSKEDIANELIGIYSYSQDGATDLVNTALESLITNLGGFKDNINEQEDGGDLETEEENVKLGRVINDIMDSYKREGLLTDMDTEEELYNMLLNMKAYGQTSDFFNMKRWDARYNKRKFPKAYNLLPPLEAFKLLCKHTK
jgi:hypothetical protein